jgi:uncharacterized protein YciI
MNTIRTSTACGALFLAVALGAAQPVPSIAPDGRSCYWVFLNKGAGRSKVSAMAKDEVAKMQKEHVDSLGALGRQGRGLAAGPLGDDGFIRGIVVLSLTNASEIKDCFQPDPFVQSDILAVEAYRWLTDATRFQKPLEPFKLAKHTLVVVKKGASYEALRDPLTTVTMLSLMPSLRSWADTGDLAVSGPLVDAGDLVGILLFIPENGETIRAALDADPAVKAGRLKVEVHPQFMGAGVLRKPTSRMNNSEGRVTRGPD